MLLTCPITTEAGRGSLNLHLRVELSEAELHVLRARLRGGIVNKARRGEFEVPLPVGFVYDTAGRVGLDPDRQVQDTLRALYIARCAAVRRPGATDVH